MSIKSSYLYILCIFLILPQLSIPLFAQEKADSSSYFDESTEAYPSILPETITSEEIPDSSEYFTPTLNAYPYAFYTPETQLAYGGGGVFTFFTQKTSDLNPSKIVLSGFYSTIKTYQLFANSNLFFSQNKMAANIDLTFEHNVDRFYGIGNDTPDLGTEEYILDNVGGIFDFQMPPTIGMSDRSGIVYEYRHYSVVDTKENPYLQNDSLNGIQGGNVSGLGLVSVWDTRDNIFFPNRGGLTRLKLLFYTKDLGSDYTFSWIEADIRRYWAFKPDQVIALQLFIEAVGGYPPFYELPALGGSKKMRGYYQGRFRDYNFFTIQVEYRQYIWRRLGFVAFFSTGDVASQATEFQIQHLKKSYGIGIRFLFNREKKINLRADFGFGKDTSGVYFGMEEAF